MSRTNRLDDDVARLLTLVGLGLAVLVTVLGAFAWFMNRLLEAASG